MDSHYVFVSTTGGGLLRKPMNQPLNGVAEIPQNHVWNLWSWISPAIELVGPWKRRIRVSYIPNYKTATSDKITCCKGEQFPLVKSKWDVIFTCYERLEYNKNKYWAPPEVTEGRIYQSFVLAREGRKHWCRSKSSKKIPGQFFVSQNFVCQFWGKTNKQNLTS